MVAIICNTNGKNLKELRDKYYNNYKNELVTKINYVYN